ncbi:Galactosylceramide sulfotransferase [Holothuria leucospilota]|uniref:Galactosylceramide sulfotransferase n=1 Tax=Holothuria leucospilota TaxID=206669 RepID=A0A9Q1HIW2_HOLLE|nr:Galactosylceramide sulfotransferase [Holothuria leucospilota]
MPQKASTESKKDTKELLRTKNDGMNDGKFQPLQVRTLDHSYVLPRQPPSKHSTKPSSLSSHADREDKRMLPAASEYSSVKGHLEMKPVFQKWRKFTGRKTNTTSDQRKNRRLLNSSRGYLSKKKNMTLKEATLKPTIALLHPVESRNANFFLGRSINVSNHRSPLNTGLRKSEGGVEIRSKRAEPCHPVHRIVFLKTHKAASTTTASIFERYGYYRNLTFAVGKNHVLSFSAKFSRKHILHFPGMRGKSYDMLVNHARFNRKEMDLAVENAIFITIVRKPEDQLDSAFGYFEMYRGMKLLFKRNPLEAFMEDPLMYYQNYSYAMRLISRNGQLFDLGFEHEFDENETQIKTYIRKLDKDFDLVLITEYYDESLILLKKLMCWSFEDILYISNGIRSSSHRFQKSQELVKKIRQWNYGDLLLYEHFNKTLWRKIVEYGPTFQNDLTYFRKLRHAVLQECVDLTKVNDFDRREEKFVLKNKSDKCACLLRDDVAYTHLIKKSMFERYT